MPFLTRAEFRGLVPQLADVLAPDDATFEPAEKAASEVATRLSGVQVPSDAAEAPAALKRPVAHLVVHALIGLVSAPAEQLAWARQAEARAREDLTAEGEVQRARRNGTGTARTGCIEGLPAW